MQCEGLLGSIRGRRCGITDTEPDFILNWYKHANSYGVTFSVAYRDKLTDADAERIAQSLTNAIARLKAIPLSGEAGL